MILRLDDLDDNYTMNVSEESVGVIAVCLLGGGTVSAYDQTGRCICPKWVVGCDADFDWFEKEFHMTFNQMYLNMRYSKSRELISALCSVAVGPESVRDDFDAGVRTCKNLKERRAFRNHWYAEHKSKDGLSDWGVIGEELAERLFSDMLVKEEQ